MVVALARTASRRQWFEDARDNGRRLEVTWHREEQLVVVGLWRGETCRATFRMPVEDVPAFVHTLTDALADVLATPSRSLSVGRNIGRRPASSTPAPRSLLERLRRAWSKPLAEVVSLARYRR